MAEITLSTGERCLVDDADLSLIAGLRWRASGAARHRYAVSGRTPMLTMHRVIMDAPAGAVVDHINGDTLDNRRCNLRVCSGKQNSRNRRPSPGRTFKGVINRRGRFHAIITVDRRHVRVGGFETETEAAVAYDKAAKALHGEYARLNFDPARDWLFPYAVADSAGRI